MTEKTATQRLIDAPVRVRGARRGMVNVPQQDVERKAICPDHKDKPTTEYVGENEHGWVFRCSGWSKEEAKANAAEHPLVLFEGEQNQTSGLFHYFVVSPARAG